MGTGIQRPHLPDEGTGNVSVCTSTEAWERKAEAFCQEKVKSRQPGGPNRSVCTRLRPPPCPPRPANPQRSTAAGTVIPTLGPCRPGRTPRRDHSSPGDAQLRSPELRGELCWDVWLKSDDSVSSSPGSKVPKSSWAARQGHGSQTLPTWLS